MNSMEIERRDAEQVDDAIEAISQGDHETARQLLMEVIRRTPESYSFETDEGGEVFMRFWSAQEFMNYVSFVSDRAINWISSAYPRAFYYMGFMSVAEGALNDAMRYLLAGQKLEPSNPKFSNEIAQVLIRAKYYPEALEELEKIKEIGPYIAPHDYAASLRARGFVLLELGEIDGAESAFLESLQHEPESQLAHNELQYIAGLRHGGDRMEGYASSVVDESGKSPN